ncbi:MAG: hypothetical protein GEV04_16015 [Actinophytocola sp.]|nr:hypothetical protein [Actinophytocola sp.]
MADDFRGCSFVNAAAELADLDHPARAVISEHKASVRDQLETVTTTAGYASTGEVAEECFLLLEGLSSPPHSGATPNPYNGLAGLHCASGHLRHSRKAVLRN